MKKPIEQKHLNNDQKSLSGKGDHAVPDVSHRPGEFRRTEQKVKRLFKAYKKSAHEMKKSSKQDEIMSRIDYKLAQRFDSAGHHELSRKMVTLSERKQKHTFGSLMAYLHNRTALQWAGIGTGIVALTLIFCGVLAFGFIYYRGTDVPILRDAVEQTAPVLSMTKAVETEYGVAVESNDFTISTRNDVTFRSLGLQNKVSVQPAFDFDLEVSKDRSSISIIPTGELQADTEYTVTVRKGTMFSDGTSLAQDLSWVFRTEPAFAVTGITPRDGTDTAPVDTTIEVEFTYKNLDTELFQQYFEISPAVEGRFELYGKKIVFIPSQNFVPYSQYTVTVKEGFPNGDGDTLPETITSTFRISSADSSGEYIQHPTMTWSEESPIISTTREPWLGMYSYDLSGAVEFTLYSAQKEALIDVMKDYHWQIAHLPDPDHIEKIREFALSPEETEFFNIDLNDYGIYFLEAYNASYGRAIYKFLIYSPLGIVYSDAKDSTRVWLSDMNEKETIGGATVDYYDFDTSEIPVFSEETDSNGSSVMEAGGGDFVIVEYSENYAVGGSYLRTNYWWYVGGIWDRMDVGEMDYRAYVYTDRPLYRPGDTVHFKTIIRNEDDMVYSLPENKQVTVRLGDYSYWWYGMIRLPYYEEVFDISKDFGTATGDFVIPANIGSGYQSLSAYIDGVVAGSTSFTIADYEKPRYQYTMSFDKDLAFSGDTLTIEVDGTDYSGDPAAGQKVGLNVSKAEVGGSWIEDPEEFQTYYRYGGSTIADETMTLDENGRAVLEVPLDVASFSTDLGSYSASMWSKENYVNHDSDSMLVANSSHGLFMKSDQMSIKEGDGAVISVRTAHLWDMEREGGVRVEYDVTRKWTTWVENGDYYDPITKTRKPLYRSSTTTAVVLKDQELTTDAQGSATINLSSLEKGSYTIDATYYDGETVFQRTFTNLFYVYEPPESGEPMYSDWGSSWEKIKIYTDKESYAPGETAHIAVKTTLTGSGIYMVKRGDVYSWRVADLSSGFLEILQEITSEMVPNVQICVWGIDEYASSANSYTGIADQYLTNIFTNQCTYIEVNEDRGRLSVTLTPDQDSYIPGDEATLDISVTDSSGRGAEGEVSVAVVDKALLDLMSTSSGYSYDVYSGFYETVRQQSYQASAPFQYGYTGGYGAGGGGDAPVRSNFADSAFWTGKVRTDSLGHAEVSFTLPDNLTTWVAKAVVVTEDTWVGQGTVNFIARKDVRLDTLVPEYLRGDDTWTMELEAANYSEDQLNARVTVECDGCTDESYSSEVLLGAGSRKVVPFTLEPAAETDRIYVTGTITAGGTTYDSVAWDVPILPVGFEHNETVSRVMGEVSDGESISMAIPSGTDVGRTKFHITFSRSYINEWALTSVDPTVSSSIDLAGSIIHNSFFVEHYNSVLPSENKPVFEQKIESALDLLEKNQSDTGGFGWFDYDAVNYEVSSYVGIALGRALDAGIEIDEGRIENLKSYLWNGLYAETTSIGEKLYAAYALTVLDDSTVLPFLLEVKSQPELFSNSVLDTAHLMLALEELGSFGDAGELAQYLENAALLTERSATWQEADTAFTVLRTKEYVTSVAYMALSPLESGTVEELARTWLVENPVSIYGCSPDAVAIFYALASTTLENLSGRQGAVKVAVSINGNSIRNFDVSGGADTTGTVDLPVDSSYLTEGLNTIEITRDGDGELYVIASMTYTTDEAATQSEFAVSREIVDFTSGNPVSSVTKGQVVTIRTEVTVDRGGYNLVMTDMLPSGFEPVRYDLGSYDYTFYSKWWKWGEGNYTNRYGRPASDRVTFTEYEVIDGTTYAFEYPAVATFTGTFSGGGAQAYLLGFGDVGGYVLSPEVEVEN